MQFKVYQLTFEHRKIFLLRADLDLFQINGYGGGIVHTIYWFPAIPGIGKVPWVCALPDQVPTADPVNVLVLFRILGGLQSVLGPRGL